MAGLNATTAKNIVAYREENGAFTRAAAAAEGAEAGPEGLRAVRRLPAGAGERSVLDHTGVHPESYAAAQKAAPLCGYTLADVRDGKLGDLRRRAEAYGEEKAAAELRRGRAHAAGHRAAS